MPRQRNLERRLAGGGGQPQPQPLAQHSHRLRGLQARQERGAQVEAQALLSGRDERSAHPADLRRTLQQENRAARAGHQAGDG